jgi:hypothetical protein
MTKEELALIESQFENLAKLFETQLKSSQKVICNKFDGLEERLGKTEGTVETHIEWHNSINRKIVATTFKGGLIIFAVVAVLTFIAGAKEGILTTIAAKMIG